jgi:hypothetical protein
MTAKARKPIAKIDGNTFRPRRFTSRRGTHKLFSALPQPAYTTRYTPLDSVVLKNLLGLLVRGQTHPNYVALAAAAAAQRTTPLQGMYSDFDTNRAVWWSRLFDFSKLHGIQIPGAPLPERITERKFSFYM